MQEAHLLVDVRGTLQKQVGEDHAGGQAVHADGSALTRSLRPQRPLQVRNSCSAHPNISMR